MLRPVSAATIFCLGADEIVMHPNASLGPIDPQITIQLPDGSQRHFAFEDLGAFFRFLKIDADISQESHISDITKQLFNVVDPVNVGAAKRASELATDVGERILQMHMDQAEAKRIAVNLNKSFFAHSDAVSRKRAKTLGLKIATSDVQLEKLIWNAYLEIEKYMELRKPFIPLQHFIEGGGASVIQPIAPLNIPPNTPPQLAQTLWQQVANTILGNLGTPAMEVDYKLVNAIIESVRLASEHVTIGKLSGSRQANGEIRVSGTNSDSGWKMVDLPQDSESTPEDTNEVSAPEESSP